MSGLLQGLAVVGGVLVFLYLAAVLAADSLRMPNPPLDGLLILLILFFPRWTFAQLMATVDRIAKEHAEADAQLHQWIAHGPVSQNEAGNR